MRTSDFVPHTVIAREAAVASALVASLLAMTCPGDLGASLRPHPAWIVVLLLAARYGGRGLALALPIASGALALGGLVAGTDSRAWSLLSSAVSAGANLGALGACVLTAWVASSRERRASGAAEALAELEARAAEESAALASLQENVQGLRARADHLEYSISFLREISSRLDGHEPVAAAEAALDLAMARTGARAGLVQITERGSLRTLAWKGAWSADAPVPPDLLRDRTAYAALRGSTAVDGTDLPALGPADSDVAAPIQDADGEAVGVLALRGLPPGFPMVAGMNDLALIASWCGQSIASDQGERRHNLLPSSGDTSSHLHVLS